jgi:hypothetical protein
VTPREFLAEVLRRLESNPEIDVDATMRMSDYGLLVSVSSRLANETEIPMPHSEPRRCPRCSGELDVEFESTPKDRVVYWCPACSQPIEEADAK